jgi:tRNA (adenine37-N6)-methyltransferase
MINLQAVAYVKNSRTAPIDDHWEAIVSTIELADDIPTEAFEGIELFSHLDIIFHFDKAASQDITFAAHPRGNLNYPKMGIFAQRKKDRPNRIGLCTVRLLRHEGRRLIVSRLDAIDGSPILDIKPVFSDFLPQGDIQQPDWVAELMRNYWS